MKKQTKTEKKEEMLLLIAFASLKHNDEPTDLENLHAEKSRLERIAENFYKNSPDQEYNQFLIDWLRENAHDIVYTDKFVYDVNIPDEPYDLNVDLFCRKSIMV